MVKYYRTLAEALAHSTLASYITFQHSTLYGSSFAVFKNFYEFIYKRNRCNSNIGDSVSFNTYLYMHEVVIEPEKPLAIRCRNKSFLARKDGRLCFDFDLAKNAKFDANQWQLDVEYMIKLVYGELYIGFENDSCDYNISVDNLYFVWSNSTSPNKISMHLIVKGLYFEDWIPMSE